MRQTTFTKPAEVERTWYVVDGTGKTLGRLATEVAAVLRGIVVNADKIEMTGNKLDTKNYYNHSGYAGGLRTRSARVMKENYTVEWVERAIYGMLPHTKLGDVMRKHLFVYKGSEHPHTAQKPVEMVIKG